MALGKEMVLDSGVKTNYHRIVTLMVVTNVQNTIEVASYTNEEKRLEEQKAIENGEGHNVFIHTHYIEAPYNQEMSIKTAYEYLKTLPEFSGAVDV